jgi:hypothetical protein
MELGFVETPNRRRPNQPQPEFSPQKLFFLGLALIFGFSIALLPFGAYLPVSISIWALLIFFLPLLFIGISLISTYGYVILFAVFLALVNGGVSILFFGDYIGYVTQTTAISNIDPAEAIQTSHYKYIFLKDYVLKEEEGGSFQAPIMIRARGNAKYYGPILKFRYVPIVSTKKPDSEIGLYAICYADIAENCIFSSAVSGGSVLRETIWDSEKTNVTGKSPSEGAIFLVWRAGGKEEFSSKGLASFVSFAISILIWAYLCFRFKH